jgi:hypothetical protein
VLKRQGPQSVRQGKDHMDVERVEPLALPSRTPGGLGCAMAFGAATVPARVVRLRFTTEGLSDLVMEVACGLHNFRVSCRHPLPIFDVLSFLSRG